MLTDTAGVVHERCPISSVQVVGPGLYVVSARSHSIASSAGPGQFINIKVSDTNFPLLRRPFSISSVDGDRFSIVFNAIGQGTRVLAHRRPGELLDCIGPLGNCFRIEDSYETALLVAGGLGVAPLPILSRWIAGRGRRVLTFLGARNREQLAVTDLPGLQLATDDGSLGFRGTVIELLQHYLTAFPVVAPKIFGCGPTAMLRNLASLALARGIPCEVSLETSMACGIGICQGCPVERKDGPGKYALVCKEGPVFDVRTIRI